MTAYLSPAFVAHMEQKIELWEYEQFDPDLKNWAVLPESEKDQLKQ